MDSLFDIPEAVKRMGESLFLKLPLYASPQSHTPIYINHALYDEIFGSESEWQNKAQKITELLSVTLDPGLSAQKQMGWAYVDYQSDPHWGSMAGNLGSGRAYYTGKYFNIKGEKTPLAVSSRSRFSDGFLEMERGIWETVVSNSLVHEFSVGIPNVLAILDMHETCHVEWRNEAVPRVKIIRIDRDGALDRVSHLLHTPKPINVTELKQTAEQFGKLEAEKFTYRITHGAWSPGNISMQGHLIDFDTVAAVKGRHAQHSSSPAYIENYFGFEWMGLKKILEVLAADARINVDNIAADTLVELMMLSRQQQISRRLSYLMGFENHDDAWHMFRDEFDVLTQQFLTLASIAYPKKDALFCKNGSSNTIHGFDIACFMRHYPLMKHAGEFTNPKALSLMMDITLVDMPFLETIPLWLTDSERLHLQQLVYARLDTQLMRSSEDLQRWMEIARDFIGAYDYLFASIQQKFSTDTQNLEARAYVINEDRFYFLPAFTPTYLLSRQAKNLSPQQMDARIQEFIFASKRKPIRNESGFFITDTKLFKEGTFFWQLDGAGACYPVFRFQLDGLAMFPEMKSSTNYSFTIDGLEVPATVIEETEKSLVIRGTKLPIAHLLAHAYREKALMFYEILIKWGQNWMALTDFLEIPTDEAGPNKREQRIEL